MLKWGMTSVGICVLCNLDLETHHRLFFECSYSAYVWSYLLQKNELSRGAFNLAQEIIWASQYRRSKNFRDSIFKLSTAASLDHLWCERNWRIFQNQCLRPEEIIPRIVRDLRACIASWRHARELMSVGLYVHNEIVILLSFLAVRHSGPGPYLVCQLFVCVFYASQRLCL